MGFKIHKLPSHLTLNSIKCYISAQYSDMFNFKAKLESLFGTTLTCTK
uniref:Uncharacterized protein n=1 Tax=Zonotrichia albicollis TaxID=44394 RepID=A0A8D2ND14_ZONAL